MKRIFTFLAISLSISLMAQERPLISSAVIALDRGDLAEAKRYISEADEIISTKDKSEIRYKDLRKFYYYKGMVNLRIASSDKPEVQAMDPDALNKAAQAFKNVIEYEASIGKESYTDEAKEQLPTLAGLYAQEGLNAAQSEKFEEAYQDFMNSYELKKELGLGTDTTMLYNAALMAQNAENYTQALDILNRLIEMNYRGITYKATEKATGNTIEFPSRAAMEMAVKAEEYTDPRIEGDLRPDLYVNAANLYLTTGDTAQYDIMVAQGRKKYPENEALLRAELQKFLETKAYDKALVNLNQAIEKDPSNKLFRYIKGYILQTSMDSLEAAREAYQGAIEVDSNYLEPLYMMGLTYVDEANKLSKEMNALLLNAKNKYDQLKNQQEQAFKNALPYFKAAREVNPDDLDTLNALKEVYYKLKMRDEAMEVQKIIEEKS